MKDALQKDFPDKPVDETQIKNKIVTFVRYREPKGNRQDFFIQGRQYIESKPSRPTKAPVDRTSSPLVEVTAGPTGLSMKGSHRVKGPVDRDRPGNGCAAASEPPSKSRSLISKQRTLQTEDRISPEYAMSMT